MSLDGPTQPIGTGFYTSAVPHGDWQVRKSYRGLMSPTEAVDLRNLHDDWLGRLRALGIKIPNTEMILESADQQFTCSILQERFETQELARQLVKSGSGEIAMRVGLAIVDDAFKFCTSEMLGKFGFHPTIRNYAYRDGQAYYLDTFPPLSTMSDAVEFTIRHAPRRRANIIFMFAPKRYIAECLEIAFDPVRMISGIAHTMSLMRPELGSSFKDEIKKVAQGVDTKWAQALISSLDQPLKTPWYRAMINIIRGEKVTEV